MKKPQETKEKIRLLGNDFANRKSREELYRLINSCLHGRHVEIVSDK